MRKPQTLAFVQGEKYKKLFHVHAIYFYKNANSLNQIIFKLPEDISKIKIALKEQKKSTWKLNQLAQQVIRTHGSAFLHK